MKYASSSKVSGIDLEIKIRCSHPHCKKYNSLKETFCSSCGTPVVKQYLWTTEPITPEKSKTSSTQKASNENIKLIGSRYFAVNQRVVLDTKPEILAKIPRTTPHEIVTYLKLLEYFPHIPKVYGQLNGTNIWLLDYGTVPLTDLGELKYAELIPSIASCWKKATPLRQIHWLRQIASLWQPLYRQGVVSTLINPNLIGVNGSLLQIVELESTIQDEQPTLKDLGKLWLKWSQNSNPQIKKILEKLSLLLRTSKVTKIQQVIAVLDWSLTILSKNYHYSYSTFAISDSGPSRNHNEDAAYPNPDNSDYKFPPENSVAIVCDGVGGHDGGEIAARETIGYLIPRLYKIYSEHKYPNPGNMLNRLGLLTKKANDLISERNDNEQRSQRKRMGTTLVMSLSRHHEMFLTHVGDSRIYWITPQGCYQVTVDDDLASREVRLGYATYSEALQYPSAGALIQALGMRGSDKVHPNVQRLIIDENCAFLLCSDGLSDFNRVEQYWRYTILPMVKGQQSIEEVTSSLIKIANEKNGHDNVTVALVNCQVKLKNNSSNSPILWSDIEPILNDIVDDKEIDTVSNSYRDTLETQLSIQEKNKLVFANKSFLIFMSIFLLTSVVAIVGFFLSQKSIDSPNNESPESVEIESIDN